MNRQQPFPRRLSLVLVAVLVISGAAAVWAWNAYRTTPESAPDFTLQSTGYENGTLGEPVTFNLTDYRGQVVLLDFMAVSCSSCRIVTDEIVKPLHAEYGGDGLAVLSIDVWAGNYGESRESLIGLQKEENTTWRHALDTDEVMRKYGAYALPQIGVVDKEGDLAYFAAGIPPKGEVEAAVTVALRDESGRAELLQVGLIGLAFVAGAASIFTPCSVGLLPGYMGLLLRRGSHSGQVNDAGTVRATLGAGLVTGTGVVTLYALLAILLWAFGPALRPHVDKLGPVVGIGLLALGVLMLVGVDWSFLTRWSGGTDSKRGYYAFGIGYGLASFGCTGPVFLPILFAGFLEGAWTGGLVFAAYAVAVALLVFAAAYLVATSQVTLLRRLVQNARHVMRASAVLMAAAGAYLIWFYYRAHGATLGF